MRVVVIGATGVIGRHLVPRLVEYGHEVRAIVLHPERAAWLSVLGVEVVPGNILDRPTLQGSVHGYEMAINLATSVPRPGQPGDYSMNDRIRREGTRNFLDACIDGGADRFIQQSITFLYGDHGAQLMTEDMPLQPPPVAQSAVEMEDIVRAAGLDWLILRGGALYGPGTGREDHWRKLAQDGQLRWTGDGDTFISLIHVADFARAFVAAIQRGRPGNILNVVDDDPVTERDLYTYLAAQIGAPAPRPGGHPSPPSLACSNARAKSELSWAPVYPTYRSGLVH
jgi:nucleoside-diphosphate-sugar epimerase